MTPEEIRAKKESNLRASSMNFLMLMWDINVTMTNRFPNDSTVAEVHEMLLNELKRRDPESFDRWRNSADPAAHPRDFFKV